MWKFSKYHAIGNVYFVINPAQLDGPLAAEAIKTLCDIHFGIGSDGLLLGPFPSTAADFRLEIYNPDASVAEKSGNGLRIFCRYLWDQGLVQENTPFTVETLGGVVQAVVQAGGRQVTVQMGQVSFSSQDIPVIGAAREVLREPVHILDRDFEFSGVTIGNPHCVVLVDDPSEALARKYGPFFETHPNFPTRTNVQFVRVLDRGQIYLEIWERGAGYTLASGSSSCAAVAVAHRLGLVDHELVANMPGGRLQIQIDDTYHLTMTGPVTHVCDGEVAAECVA
ncbi:MAG: diaminopimelate epimerase [Chloroflexota bacterium]